jgi:methionyl-tRNA formyltransferase
MRLIFMGTPDFAATALYALIAAGHDIACVYSQPPRPAHRGKQMQMSAVHLLAEQHGLPVRTHVSLKTPLAQSEFAALRADIAVVAAYGLLLPQAILDAPQLGGINIHASLLPRWRGAAPIHRALEAGDSETGVCIMQMEAGLDTGPVLLRESMGIASDETTGTLHDKLAALGAQLVVRALATYAHLNPHAQSADGITYAKKIDKAEARLDFSQSADVLERRIRAFNPAPGAYLEINGDRLKILSAAISRSLQCPATPGQLLDDQFTICCGNGTALQPLVVQRPGKQAVTTDAFLRGYQLPVGTILA